MKTRTNAPGPTDEAMPDISPTPGHIISKPWKESQVAHSWMVEQEADPLFSVSKCYASYPAPLDYAVRILSGISRSMSCPNCWLMMMSQPGRIFSTPILTSLARSLSTKPCESTIQHMTFRGVQMSLTSAQGLTSWLPPPMGIFPTHINMVDSSTFLRSPSTIKVQSRSLVDPGDKRFKSSGCAGLNKPQTMKMGSLASAFHGYNLST